jgi:hypothetical protein
MARLVTIPISFVELTISYEHPNIKAFNDRAALVQTVFDALLPWRPKLDDCRTAHVRQAFRAGL